MWSRRSLAFIIQLAVLAFLSAQYATADTLQFNIKGTYDTPSGIYPLASPAFEVTFRIESDPPPEQLLYADVVALYTTAIYINDEISTSATTYLQFQSEQRGGGIYMFLSGTPLIPGHLAIEFGRGGIPQLYSGTVTAPHFAPGIVDLDLAQFRNADQGPGPPMSNISDGVLTITSVAEPSSFVLFSTSVISLAWPVLRKGRILHKSHTDISDLPSSIRRT